MYLKAIGEIGTASALAPSWDLGSVPKKVGEDIQKATKEWRIKVMVKLSVVNRVATPSVIPTAAAMVLKELKEPPEIERRSRTWCTAETSP